MDQALGPARIGVVPGLRQELGVVGLEPERERDRVQDEDGLARLEGRVVHGVVPGGDPGREHVGLPGLREVVQELPHLALVIAEHHPLARLVRQARAVALHDVLPDVRVRLVAHGDPEPEAPRGLLGLLGVREHVGPGGGGSLEARLREQVVPRDQHEALEAVEDVMHPPVGLLHELGRAAHPAPVGLLELLIDVGHVEELPAAAQLDRRPTRRCPAWPSPRWPP